MTALSDHGSGSHLHAYKLGSDIYVNTCLRLLLPYTLNKALNGFINLFPLLLEHVYYFALNTQILCLFQECMALMRRLCVEEEAGTELADKLTEKLSENLKEVLADNKVRVCIVLYDADMTLLQLFLVVTHIVQSLSKASISTCIKTSADSHQTLSLKASVLAVHVLTLNHLKINTLCFMWSILIN